MGGVASLPGTVMALGDTAVAINAVSTASEVQSHMEGGELGVIPSAPPENCLDTPGCSLPPP